MTIVAGTMGTSIASPWRRLVASWIDQTLVLVGIGGFLELVRLFGGGPVWGLPLFVAVPIAYFALQHSVLTGGQTVGKRLLKIRVVDERGEILSLERAFGRALVSYGASIVLISSVWVPAAMALSLGLSVAAHAVSCYFILADVSGRRGIPDRLAHTWVVDDEGQVVLPRAEPLGSEQAAVATAIVGFLVVGGWMLGQTRQERPIEQPDVAIYRRVADSLGAHVVEGPIKRNSKPRGADNFDRTLFVAISADSTDAPFDSLAFRVARGVAGKLPAKNDIITIEIEVRESIGTGSTRPWHFEYPMWRLPPL